MSERKSHLIDLGPRQWVVREIKSNTKAGTTEWSVASLTNSLADKIRRYPAITVPSDYDVDQIRQYLIENRVPKSHMKLIKAA